MRSSAWVLDLLFSSRGKKYRLVPVDRAASSGDLAATALQRCRCLAMLSVPVWSRADLELGAFSLHVSPHGEAKCVRGPSGRGASRAEEKGASRLARAGVLDSTLSTASKRNEVLAVVSRASTVGW